MSRDALAEFLLQKVRISTSQEEILNSIPGWEKVASGIIDDTPSQPESSSSQHRIFDVSGSSVSDDEEFLSQKPVEWASPEPTPKSAPEAAAIGLESFNEPFDSDRSQSPKKRLSWGFARQGDLYMSDRDRQDADAVDKRTSIVYADYGATEAPHEKKNQTASTRAAAVHIMSRANDFEDERQGLNEQGELSGEPLNPEAHEHYPSGPSRRPEPVGEENVSSKSFTARRVTGYPPSSPAACLDNPRGCLKSSCEKLKANEEVVGCPPQIGTSSTHVVSSGKSLRADSSTYTSSSESDDKKRPNPSIPPRAVQEKLTKIRRVGAETAIANQSWKHGRDENRTFHVQESVIDVVSQMSDGNSAHILSAADFLRTALSSGITLPPPFSRNYFRSQ